ncbi:hypothetical protein GOP47_0015354 [Adiantum capillus-veneris]|uniref:Mitochondrial import inner membrane translocase subunit TIM17-2-like n=1 Tax=Adiantum capillus-veneris TaxID=13818 RepID=A0A9D4ZB65_ADICA|nr:hypothetical protein GOP47_0015354 [Adiantum capillus-veneris]
MAAPDQTREPCPDRILDDVGGAFGMGAVGGSAFHFIKGSKNSPKGERLFGGFQAVRMNAPRVGGSFAVWGGIFSTFDCTAVYLRQKEDPWNSIFAGAATGGFLQLRHGARSATRSAIFGGVLLALIEGISYAGIPSGQDLGNPNVSATLKPSSTEDSDQKSWLGGFFSSKKDDASAPVPSFETSSSSFPTSTLPPSMSTGEVSSPSQSTADNRTGRGSWMGGFFGKKKEEQTTTSSTSTGETLSSFETASGPPVPSFDYK